MKSTRLALGHLSGVAALLLAGTALAAPGGVQWISAGGDLYNTR